ncbi:MAG TPA: hypothetical protein VFH53_01365 [Phycisphaerae bacterium]|nr:hypothetical protein [Phycisphaerae bacterium]
MKRPLILPALVLAAAAAASALTGLLRQNRLDSPAKRVKMRRTR